MARHFLTPSVSSAPRLLGAWAAVLTIFDIDIPIPVVRQRIAGMIRENAWVKDERTIKMLVTKGYLELEEACLQYKTKHQLLNKIDPTSMRKHQESDDFLDNFLKGTL